MIPDLVDPDCPARKSLHRPKSGRVPHILTIIGNKAGRDSHKSLIRRRLPCEHTVSATGLR